MKKITSFLLVVCAAISLNAQCELADDTLFTGDYIITQVTPSIFGYDTFDPDGGGVTVQLFSEMTDGTQINPGVALTATQRSFDADYLAVLGFGNTATYFISFPSDCGVTIESGTPTGLLCNVEVLIGEASGGSFDTADDANFSLFFTDDVTDDCGTGATLVELAFEKGALGINDNKLAGFNYFVQDRSFNFSAEESIDRVEFFNILGQKTLTATLGTNNGSVNISSLPTGVYIANVTSGNKVEAIKIAVR